MRDGEAFDSSARARRAAERATDEAFLRQAIELSAQGLESGRGGPFGAVVVRGDGIVGRGSNEVLVSKDPTAHAEVQAIRDACRQLDSFQLDGCTLYTSCEPCPMCLGAIYWARPDRVVYAASKADAARAGFDDAFIYEELALRIPERRLPMEQLLRDEALRSFELWRSLENRTEY